MKDYYQIDKDHDLNSLLEIGLIKDAASFYEGNIFKYVYRHRNKNGLEDLKKARNYLNLLMELEYGAETEATPVETEATTTETEATTTGEGQEWLVHLVEKAKALEELE